MNETTSPLLSLYRDLQEQVEQRPYETLAIAAGVGFVIGGGLVSKLGARLIASGIRVGLTSAVAPLVTSLLQEVSGVVDGRPVRTQHSAQHPS